MSAILNLCFSTYTVHSAVLLTLFSLLVLHTSGQLGQHVRHFEFMPPYTVHMVVLLTLFSMLVLHTSG